MRTYTRPLGGSEATIYYPETTADLDVVERVLRAPLLGLDTETTGSAIYKRGAGVRLVQLSTATEAVVFDAEHWRAWLRHYLGEPGRRYVAHNATFDLLALDRHLGVPLEVLADRTEDSYIVAHLLDPRRASEGGTGLKLKEDLGVSLIDPTAADEQRALVEVFRRELHCTKAEGWAKIAPDHPIFVRYAGLDPILTIRLWELLQPRLNEAERRLYDFEIEVQLVLARMKRRGILLDVDYVHRLRDDLLAESERARETARRYGVENVSSPKQVAAALAAMPGVELLDRTPTGQPKVDQSVLLQLADMDRVGDRIGAHEPNRLAEAVILAKRGMKWASSYAEAFLDLRDEDDRLHANIDSLGARTGRMSVSQPPLQQLPSTDWRVRRALIADPGMLLVSADYAQVELRILAALAREQPMIDAIQRGDDLHGYTAQLVYGEDYTPAQRKLMKGVGFGKVYGGGAQTLARQTGAPLPKVKAAVAAYDRVYPHIRRYGDVLQQQATAAMRVTGRYSITTPSGRTLPLDRDRTYSAVNYVCQSTSRDVTASALLELDKRGLGDLLLLPIHDEVLAQAPRGQADEVAHEIAEAMTMSDFYGVPLEAEGKIVGPSWGTAYGCPPELDAQERG